MTEDELKKKYGANLSPFPFTNSFLKKVGEEVVARCYGGHERTTEELRRQAERTYRQWAEQQLKGVPSFARIYATNLAANENGRYSTVVAEPIPVVPQPGFCNGNLCNGHLDPRTFSNATYFRACIVEPCPQRDEIERLLSKAYGMELEAGQAKQFYSHGVEGNGGRQCTWFVVENSCIPFPRYRDVVEQMVPRYVEETRKEIEAFVSGRPEETEVPTGMDPVQPELF